MIASPGDVSQERRVIRDVIDEWNTIYSEDRRIVLMPVGWEPILHQRWVIGRKRSSTSSY